MTGKLFRNICALAALVLVISGTLFCGVLYRYYEEQSYQDLAGEAGYLIQSMEFVPLEELRIPGEVTLLHKDGHILYDSRQDTAEDLQTRPEVEEAREDGEGRSARYSETLLEKEIYYARQLPDGSILRLSRQREGVLTMALRLTTPILAVALLVALGVSTWSLHLARQITRPINTMSLDDPQDTYPELQPLVNRLRQQNTTIRQQMDELRRRVREFSTLTENMNEGFLLLDWKGQVLMCNHSAREHLHVGVKGNVYKTGCIPLRRAVEVALAGSRDERRIHEDGCILRLMANPVAVSGQVTGAVIVVMDVTEQEEREALRREFSANVSHELKTPLTSISGFAELMSQGLVPPEKMQEFSGDIYRECRRLMALVEDIIRLSRLDEGAVQPEWEDVDLHALAGEVLESLEPVAAPRQITLQLSGESVFVRGERQMLLEMIYNLCENAVKYNREGGHVQVSVSSVQGKPSLCVADNGIGIPYAHQSRVFERFYRVDKSHSRAIGGTGLGLSIVKHAAQYHNARLALHSQPGEGTEITVTFNGAGECRDDAAQEGEE